MNNSKETKLIKNTLIVGIGTISSKAIIFIMAPLFSRWLSVEEYGAFDLVTTYVSLLIPFCTLSISEAVFRFLLDGVDSKDKNGIISGGCFVLICGYSTFFVLYYIASSLFGFSFNWIICLFLFSQLVMTFFGEVARGLKKIEIYSLFNFISVVFLTGLTTIFVLFLKMGLKGIILGYSLGYLISGLGMFFATRSYKYISLSYVNKSRTSEMLKYSWPLIPNSISWWVVNVSDRIIINRWISLAANGIYAVANKIPAIVNILFSVFHVSWLQSASENVSDAEYSLFCNRVYNKLIKYIFSSITVLVSANFLYFSWLFDPKYSEAYIYSPILIIAAGVSCVGQFIGGIMIALKKTKENGATNIIAAISNIIINVVCVHKMGLLAAAISTISAYLIMVICRMITIRKKLILRMDRGSILMIGFMLIITIVVYINLRVLNIVCLFISLFVFCFINKELLLKVVGIVQRR